MVRGGEFGDVPKTTGTSGQNRARGWRILLKALTPGSLVSDNRMVTDAITRDPEVMHGTPVFRGTRVPVQTLFDYLEGGDSLEDFLEGFPTVTRQLVVQVLEECKGLRLARV